jgi:hypothetical protein
MSVAIATGGMFNNCCGGGPGVGGGGAPPVNQYAEQYDDKIPFSVKVLRVSFDDFKKKDKKLKVLVKNIRLNGF